MPRKLSVEPIGVKTLAPQQLKPNPHNPRMLFDKEPMNELRESIAKVGILVPLTVYWDQRRESFVILDGQRRWMSARALGLRKVPVNQVAPPTLVQNIVTMFQIHKLREDWELMPTALKVEILMSQLKEKNPVTLAKLTGLDQAVVVRCKKLLSYSKEFQDLMLDPDPAKRVKADFFIELYAVRNDRFVNAMTWFSRDEFTRRMLTKYLAKASGIKAVTAFRQMKQYISNARRAKAKNDMSRRLRKFTFDDSVPLEYLKLEEASVSAEARRIVQRVEALYETLRELDDKAFYGEEALWKGLERLYRLIRSKLTDAGRRIKE